MVVQALGIINTAFTACVGWTNQLLSAVDGAGVILAAFCITLVIGCLFMPLRGGNVVASWNTFRDFNMGVIHKGKYSSGSWKVGTRSKHYKGQFESGNNASKLSRRGQHERYYAGGSGKQGI